MYAARLCALLQDAGHDVALAAPSSSWIADRLKDHVELLPTSFTRTGDELPRFAAICRNHRFEVTHSHASRSHRFGMALESLTGIPHVAHAHSHHINLHWFFQRRVIALTQRSARTMHRYYRRSPESVGVLPNFVDSVRFAPRRDEPSTLTQRLGLPSPRMVILCAAAISHRKGQHLLVRALHLVRQSHPDVHLVLVGARNPDSSYDRQLDATIRECGLANHVTLTGFRDDVADLLPHAHIAALPSFDEPFALAGLEAMAAGLPLIATRVGGFPEMIINGQTGLLVPSNDAHALQRAIETLLTDESMRYRIGNAARRDVMERFNAHAHVDRYQTMLRRWKIHDPIERSGETVSRICA